MLHSVRLSGASGVNYDDFRRSRFVGRHGDKLWFTGPELGLHARSIDGDVIGGAEFLDRVPGRRVDDVLAIDGWYAGTDDGYWYKISEDGAEPVRHPNKPRSAEANRNTGFLHNYESPPCRANAKNAASPRIVKEPDTPRSAVAVNGKTIPNTSFLKVNLVHSRQCPLVLVDPPSVVVSVSERIGEPATTRRITYDGDTVWRIDESIDFLTSHVGVLLERPSERPAVFRARSPATGLLLWETKIR